MSLWIQDLVMKRLAQRTNVFIIETFDVERLEALRDVMAGKKKENLKQLFPKIDFKNVIDWDLQRAKLGRYKYTPEDKENNVEESLNIDDMENDPMGLPPAAQLDKMLLKDSTIVIAHYAIAPEHANQISDYLTAWSQDDKLHRNRSMVIVFTANPSLFNENLRKWCYEIDIPPSTPQERKALLEQTKESLITAFTQKYGESEKKKLAKRTKITDEIIEASSGLDLTATRTAALTSWYESAPNYTFDTKAFTAYKVQILKTQGIEFYVPEKGFNTIGGNNAFKKFIKNRVIKALKDPEKAKFFGVELPRGLILAGIPGTGKTVLVKAIAYELGIPLAILDASAFLRGVVGETESRVKQIIAILESLAPIVVFWDELDAVFQPRESQVSTDSGVSRRMVNALLEYLGRTDRKAFVIGATNFPQLDKAATRPGRFDNMFGIFPPDYEARKEVLKIHMNVIRKLPINEETQQKIQETIASETFGYTPAELEQIVKNACSIAMDEDKGKITLEHFRAAKESLGVNTQTRIQEVETMAKQLSTIPNVNMGFLKESLIEFGSGKDKDKTKGIIATLPDDLRGSLKAL